MINTQVLKGNLIRQDYTTAFVLNQGDKGVPFKVELLENGTPYTLQSTDIVTIEWLKPNGNPFLQEGDINYGTTYIEFTTQEAIAQYSGSGSFNIIISNGDVRKGSIRREYKVIPTSFKPGSISEDVITDAITELRELSVEIANTVQNNQDLINNNQAATKQDIANVNSSLEDIANSDKLLIPYNFLTNAEFLNDLDGWKTFTAITPIVSNETFDKGKSVYLKSTGGTSYQGIAQDINVDSSYIYNFSCYYLVKNKSMFDNNLAIEIKGVLQDDTHKTLFKKEIDYNTIKEYMWTNISLTADFSTVNTSLYKEIYVYFYFINKGEAYVTKFSLNRSISN